MNVDYLLRPPAKALVKLILSKEFDKKATAKSLKNGHFFLLLKDLLLQKDGKMMGG